MTDAHTPAVLRQGLRIRCMGPWPDCKHQEGDCTASPDYQDAVAAFRLSDQSVPTEGVTASGDDDCQCFPTCICPKPSEPTPVRGLEPVAWRWRNEPNAGWWVSVRPFDKDEGGEPLYSASDVSALQGEVERLRKALKKIAAPSHPMRCSLTNLNDRIRTATKALGEQQ